MRENTSPTWHLRHWKVVQSKAPFFQGRNIRTTYSYTKWWNISYYFHMVSIYTYYTSWPALLSFRDVGSLGSFCCAQESKPMQMERRIVAALLKLPRGQQDRYKDCNDVIWEEHTMTSMTVYESILNQYQNTTSVHTNKKRNWILCI